MLTWKIIALCVCITKEIKLKINHLSFHLKKFEKEEKTKIEVSRRNEIKDTEQNINEIENRQ